jgi:hypothetical protein
VIFRNLYRRRLVAQFGKFVDPPVLEEMLATVAKTEWQAFKSFLPRRSSPDARRAALREVARLAAVYSKGHEQETKE